jgi:hypothetical protein
MATMAISIPMNNFLDMDSPPFVMDIAQPRRTGAETFSRAGRDARPDGLAGTPHPDGLAETPHPYFFNSSMASATASASFSNSSR